VNFDGTSGHEISFAKPFNFNGTAFDIVYTGKLASDGREIRLMRKVGDFVTEERVARRVSDEKPAGK
jgi:hypothetical protein